jgi:hypothetical protein
VFSFAKLQVCVVSKGIISLWIFWFCNPSIDVLFIIELSCFVFINLMLWVLKLPVEFIELKFEDKELYPSVKFICFFNVVLSIVLYDKLLKLGSNPMLLPLILK